MKSKRKFEALSNNFNIWEFLERRFAYLSHFKDGLGVINNIKREISNSNFKYEVLEILNSRYIGTHVLFIL